MRWIAALRFRGAERFRATGHPAVRDLQGRGGVQVSGV
jgi:hypothetical protein